MSESIESAATAPLLARIAELEAANEAFGKRQEWWNARMLELEQQLAEARKDAEPWQWMKVRERWASVCIDFDPGGVYRRHRVVWHNDEGWSTAEGQSIDAAIRAAIKEQT